MKKVLVFAVALMMAMSVYAVSTAGIGTLTSADEAVVPVTFDLSGDNLGGWEIGFASDVSQFEADGTVEPLDEIVLTHNETTNIGESAANGVYVYWKLTGDQLVKISLAADDAMKSANLASGGDPEYDYLNWKTSWSENASATDGSVSSGSLGGDAVHTDTDNPVDKSDYTTAQTIYTRATTTQSEVKGSAALTIVTQNVATAAPSSYTGHLTLKIEPLGD